MMFHWGLRFHMNYRESTNIEAIAPAVPTGIDGLETPKESTVTKSASFLSSQSSCVPSLDWQQVFKIPDTTIHCHFHYARKYSPIPSQEEIYFHKNEILSVHVDERILP